MKANKSSTEKQITMNVKPDPDEGANHQFSLLSIFGDRGYVRIPQSDEAEAFLEKYPRGESEIHQHGNERQLQELDKGGKSENVQLPPTAELILVRGLPGSGNSTFADELVGEGYVHLEADMFFMKDGVYRYDANLVRDAHNWCKEKTRAALARGQRVAVSNTFARLHEMADYVKMCPKVRIIEIRAPWINVFGVSPEPMVGHWETVPPEWWLD